MEKRYPLGECIAVYLNLEKPEIVTDGKNRWEWLFIILVVASWVMLMFLPFID